MGQHMSQQMKLAPRMIQSMEILQMQREELEARIEQEKEENVTLEDVESDDGSGEGEETEEADSRSVEEDSSGGDESGDPGDIDRGEAAAEVDVDQQELVVDRGGQERQQRQRREDQSGGEGRAAAVEAARAPLGRDIGRFAGKGQVARTHWAAPLAGKSPAGLKNRTAAIRM